MVHAVLGLCAHTEYPVPSLSGGRVSGKRGVQGQSFKVALLHLSFKLVYPHNCS